MHDPYALRIQAAFAEYGIDPDLAKRRLLTLQREPDALVVAHVAKDGHAFELTPDTAAAWKTMQTAAWVDGVPLALVSAFRSVDVQCGIIRRKLDNGMAIGEILQSVAPPGYSEHHTGRAIDIGTTEEDALEEVFENTPSFVWLQANARRFGFVMSYPAGNPEGFVYEPWHWCLQEGTEATLNADV